MKRVIVASETQVNFNQDFMKDLYYKLKSVPRTKGSNDGTLFGFNTRPGHSDGVIFGKVDGQGYALYTKSYRDKDKKWNIEFVRYEELDDKGLDAIRGRFSR